MRIPTYNTTADVYTGYADTPAGSRIYQGLVCEVYESSLSKRGGEVDPATLAYWTLLTAQMGRPRDGYDGVHDIWYPGLAYNIRNIAHMDPSMQFTLRAYGVRWLNTAAQHSRWYMVPVPSITGNPQPQVTAPVLGGVPVTFDCYRPFGAAAPVFTNKQGTLYNDLVSGRGGYSGGQYSIWTHYLDFASSLDVRDAMSRSAGLDSLTYADGDEIRIPTGASSTRYVVMRVITYLDPGGIVIKRAYLVRDQPRWPGP